jgi:hypothetical protein
VWKSGTKLTANAAVLLLECAEREARPQV